jgi:predicted nucleic acid-binding protein
LTLVIAWYFEDEGTPATDELLDRVADTGATVPGLWRLEVANAFEMAVRRQRIDKVYRDASLNELTLMPITIDADTSSYAWSTTLRIADRFSLTIYDAAYLELAQRRSLPLATLDQALRAAAPALNVELLGAA